MAYGDVKRQVLALAHTVPAGLTTQQIYERADARTAGEQSHIRTELRKLAKKRDLLRIAIRPKSGRGGATYVYFPTSPEGRRFHELASTTPPVPTSSGIPQVRSVPATTRVTGARRTYAKRGTLLPAILTLLKDNPNGMKAQDIANHLGRTYDGIRNAMTIAMQKGKLLRVRTGFASSAPDQRGGAPFLYYPKTPEGRAAYQARKNAGKTVGFNVPRVYDTSTKTTNGTTQPTFGKTVEALVRITLPDGTHDVPFDTARQLQSELAEVFG